METLFQLLTLLTTLHANAGSDRCAQLDTVQAGESLPDMIGLSLCDGSADDGTIYYGQPSTGAAYGETPSAEPDHDRYCPAGGHAYHDRQQPPYDE